MSGSGDGGVLLNVTDNTTSELFNCLSSNLSSTNVSVSSHWRISDDLLYGTPVVATVYVIFFLLAFFWNLFIIVTYIVKRHLLNEPGNIFLFNLALVDILLTITVLVYSTVTEIAQEFVFGSNDIVRCRFCDAAGFFLMLLIMCSLHILMALSIDRFILLSSPLRYKQLMNKWKTLIIIVIIWVWCFIIGILPVVGFGQNEFNIRFGSCLPRFTGENPSTGINNFYYAAFVAIEALIPVVILGFTNIFTYRLVSKFLRRNLRRRSTFRKKEDVGQSKDEKKHQKQQQQLVRVFGALFVSNIISWTPTIVVVLLIFAIPAENFPNELYIFGHIAFLTSPVFHPILESFFVKDLRYQIKRAHKGVRRASTLFIRQTTKSFFGGTALDKANRAMDEDDDEALRNAKRNKALNESVFTDSSIIESSADFDSIQESGEVDERRAKLAKLGRSVTFNEDGEYGDDLAADNVSNTVKEKTDGSILKKSGKYKRGNRSPPPSVAIMEEDEDCEEFEGRENDDEKKSDGNEANSYQGQEEIELERRDESLDGDGSQDESGAKV